MKNAILALVFSIVSIALAAQTPQALNYQAIARNNSGSPIANQLVSIRISILQGSINGTPVYIETHQDTTNNFGLLNLQIGNGSVQSGIFSNIDWGSSTYFSKVEIDPTGGTAYQTLGTTQMLSVPYALYANTAGKVQNGADKNIYYVSTNPQIIDHADLTIDSSLAWTIARAANTSGKVVLKGNKIYNILQDVIVPNNVILDFFPTAIIHVPSNVLIDIEGTFSSPTSQIFSGDGAFRLRSTQYILPQWFGAKGDGENDDTEAIKKAIEVGARFFTFNTYPPTGEYASPIISFKPGSYKVTDEIPIYSGLTITGLASNPFTNGHTRIIMDNIGANKNIFKPTRTFSDNSINNLTITVQDLEFWYVTQPPGNIYEPAGGPSYGNNGDGTPKFNGCAIYIGEQCVDVRIKRCNFFQSPFASIMLAGDPNDPNSNHRNIVIDECEFDTGNRFIRAENVDVDLVVKASLFYSGSAQYDIVNCIGNITTNDSRFDYNPHIVIQSSHLHSFHFIGNHHTNDASVSDISGGFITLDNAEIVNISSNTFDKVRETTIHVISARGGVISNNAINNSGINTTNTAPNINFGQDLVPAAIRLSGCKNIIVSGNSVTTTDSGGSFGGFGIYTRDYLANSQGNYIFGNLVSGNYSGANWNGQNRKVNIETDDTKLNNL